MNLKQLEVFLAVAESGSFSRGAELALLTQSTVSQHISVLEQELGVRLLDRTGKGAQLTEGGKVLLQRARRVMQEVRHIQQAMGRYKGLDEGSLRVGGSNVPGIYLLPVALGQFCEQFPKLEVTVLQGGSREIVERLGRDEMDLAVTGSCFPDTGVIYEPLVSDEIGLVVNEKHPWRGRESLDLEELPSQWIVAREAGSGTDKTVREAFARAGANYGGLKFRARLGSNEAVKQAVLNGVGAAFLSTLSVRKEFSERTLHEVPVTNLSIKRNFHLALRMGRELSPAATAFVDVLTSLYGAGNSLSGEKVSHY